MVFVTGTPPGSHRLSVCVVCHARTPALPLDIEMNPQRRPFRRYLSAMLALALFPVVVAFYVIFARSIESTASLQRRASSALLPRYLDLLEGVLTNRVLPGAGRCKDFITPCLLNETLPFDASLREGGADWPPLGLTMVGTMRVRNVRMAIESVLKYGVMGDFVELGVWRGGVGIFAREMLDALGATDRRVVLFDAFAPIGGYGGAAPFLSVSLDSVRASFAAFGALSDRVDFRKGLFNDTLPRYAAETRDRSIAVLRLDGNYYSSHSDPLYALYDRVPVGGFILFDDMKSHPDVKLAWEHFMEDQGFLEEMHLLPPIDTCGAWVQKTQDVAVVHSKRRPEPLHVANFYARY